MILQDPSAPLSLRLLLVFFGQLEMLGKAWSSVVFVKRGLIQHLHHLRPGGGCSFDPVPLLQLGELAQNCDADL